MFPFVYHRAVSLEDARDAYASAEEPAFLAGGQTLIPTLKMRLAHHDRLIDLRHVPGLSGVRQEADSLVVGAMTTHQAIADSTDVAATLPALARLAGSIGDREVRHMGTLGGSIANNDPSADFPAALLALGATVLTERRQHDAADFFKGLFETALEPGEIITEVRFPVPTAAAYAKVRNPASRYAVVGVFVARFGTEARVAVTGAGPKVFRLDTLEHALSDDFRPEALEGITVSPDGLNADQHASAEYRAHLCMVLARKAVGEALSGR